MLHTTTSTSQKNDRGTRQSNLSADLEKIKAAIADATGDVKGKAQEALLESIDHLQEKYSAAQKTAATYVNENPLKAIGMTFAAGIILGLLLRK